MCFKWSGEQSAALNEALCEIFPAEVIKIIESFIPPYYLYWISFLISQSIDPDMRKDLFLQFNDADYREIWFKCRIKKLPVTLTDCLTAIKIEFKICYF